jgi:hypothetical protein
MRRFVLNRTEDKTGISGTGIVAEGVLFTRGKVAVTWLTQYTSIVIYDSMEHVEAIHGHGGATMIEYLDDAP